MNRPNVEGIDFEKELKNAGIPEKDEILISKELLLGWGKFIAARVEEQTIQRMMDYYDQAFKTDDEVKIERLYSSASKQG